MTARVAALIFFGSIALLRADQLVESVQQALKDQGFYYGEVTGEMNANVTAAIRRYQIRNGLQVSGQLNPETLQSLGIQSSAAAPTTATKPAPPGPATQVKPDGQQANEPQNESPAPPAQGFANAPPDQQVYPSNPATAGGVFAGTPFQAAPPGVQRNILLAAQIALARQGLYHEQIDGIYGPAMEFSLRAYQARTKLPVTGRLDLETVAALQLLPGPRRPYYDPTRRRMRPPFGPPVRGDWIPGT